MNPCRSCGEDLGSENPPADHCGGCPPWRCDDCGQMDSMANPCQCWQSFEGMNLADIKATFAADGTFNITPGTTL